MQNFIFSFGTILIGFQSCTHTFHTTTDFTDHFKRLNAILKEFEMKDHREQPILKIKMIDLNRKTLPLYKRLDEKNKTQKTDTNPFFLFPRCI